MARSFGSANVITPGYVCHSPRLGLYGLVTGYGRLYCDYHGWGGEFPKTQIMWAKQLEISSADSEMCYWFMNSLDYCKNLIIIDPSASAYATRANLWIQPRPGTDSALAMAMCNVIIEEELWDKEFVGDWSYGFEEFRERCKEFTPEKVSDICWIAKGADHRRPLACSLSTPRDASRSAAPSSAKPTAATACVPSPA